MQLNGRETRSLQGSESPPLGTAILTAALALPGLHAHADAAPEQGEIRVRYADYKDSQPGFDRISVHSPSISLLVPVAGVWAFEGSLVSDHVSGASPRYHTAVSGASRMDDSRSASDIRVTRYFARGSFSAGAAYSDEHDYRSRALSMQGSVSTEDKNTTLTLGVGASNDVINPVNHIVSNEKKHTLEWIAGLTQVMSMRDIVQANFTHAAGRGYFNDPYKLPDIRPRERNQDAVLLRWNHHFENVGGTSRLSYRYYRDSYGIRAHTFSGEYVQPAAGGWTFTPSARIHSQSAADFYYDPVYDRLFGAPFPPGYTFNPAIAVSPDQRLSAFGACTLGIKVEKQVTRDLSFDVKVEDYRQRGSWRLFGSGSPGLEPFSARMIQVGMARRW